MTVTLKISTRFEAQDGFVNEYTEDYTREGDEGPKAVYWQQVQGRSGNMGYSGFADDAAFRSVREAAMQERAESAYRNREADAERKRLCAYFDEKLEAPVRETLSGLNDADEIIGALRQGCEWHDLTEALETLLAGPKRVTRSTLREAWADAKRSVREDYPEEYRENGADDFYEDHGDDIAEAMAGSLS